MEREGKNLEYKEIVTKSYLKTVSAFSNYNDGEIVFGVNDNYEIIGIQDPKRICLDIENQINDSIKPHPVYSLRINSNNTISLIVKKGNNTPYRYNGKAYFRNDSSTLEVDEVQEKRLILEGMNLRYEELPCNKSELSFEFLSQKLIEKMKLSNFNLDILKSLELYSEKEGFNNAAYLLADKNNYNGLDIIVFGNNINEFRRRYTFNNVSILKQYYDAIDIYENEYTIEKIEGALRVRHELIPLEAFRETIANALIHRTWDINVNIKVEMHPSRIVVSSPGGLMSGMSKEDFLNGNYSYLRNPIIADVFHRLDIVEKFATGIRRINEAYSNSIVKPSFSITDSSIIVCLPIINDITLNINEKSVYDFMKSRVSYSRLDLEKELIIKDGKAKNTFYIKK